MTILIRSLDESCSNGSNSSSEGNSNNDSSSVTNSMAFENAIENGDSHQENLHHKISKIRMFHSNVLLISLGVFMLAVHLGLTVAWLFCGYIIRNAVSNIILLFGLDLFVILVGCLGISACKSRKKESLERNHTIVMGALHWMACMFGLTIACFVLLSQSCVEFSQSRFYQNLFETVMNDYNSYENVDIPFVKPPFVGSEMDIQTQENLMIYSNPIINLLFFFLLSTASICTTLISYQRFIKKNHKYLFPKSTV